MSAPDHSVEARYSGTQADLVDFLGRLEKDKELRAEYEQDPIGVLERNGWALDLPDDYPSRAVAPSPEEIRAAVSKVKQAALWPWIWKLIPWVGKPSGEEEDDDEDSDEGEYE